MTSDLKYYYQCKYAVEKQTWVRYKKLLVLFSRHSGEKPRSGQGCPSDGQDREYQAYRASQRSEDADTRQNDYGQQAVAQHGCDGRQRDISVAAHQGLQDIHEYARGHG